MCMCCLQNIASTIKLYIVIHNVYVAFLASVLLSVLFFACLLGHFWLCDHLVDEERVGTRRFDFMSAVHLNS